MFALVDCNNFYASCERLFQPKLRNKPIVVLSNNDGCVIARSNEAKALGIPMGALPFQLEALFEKEKVHVFSSNYALYGDMSNRVMDTLRTFCPEIEVYSIDEAFLKFNSFQKYFDLNAYGREIRNTVTSDVGIPISVGIAPTKALAKVANRIAKKYPARTQSSYVIDTDEKRLKALKWLPIEDVWGIGRQHAKRLHQLGVRTAYDFTLLSADYVRKIMSVVGLRLQKELQGVSCLALEDISPKKTIATTRSFEKNYTDLHDVNERVATFAATCAQKLRAQKSCCNTLMVFIHTNGHRTDLPQYSRNIVMKLPFPTNSSLEIARFASQALKTIFKTGYAYKKAGVVVMDLTPQEVKQLNLFQNSNEKHKPLMEMVDKINKTLGIQKIKLASQDLDKTWKMRQEKLSPRYTTKINEVIKVKA